LAALVLAGVGVDPVVGDLAAVHVKPTYDWGAALPRVTERAG
jgi:hypothetical protein